MADGFETRFDSVIYVQPGTYSIYKFIRLNISVGGTCHSQCTSRPTPLHPTTKYNYWVVILNPSDVFHPTIKQ